MHGVVFANEPPVLAKGAVFNRAWLLWWWLLLKGPLDLAVQPRRQVGVKFTLGNPPVHLFPAFVGCEADQPAAIRRDVQIFFGLIERAAVKSSSITLFSRRGVRATISERAAMMIQVMGLLIMSCMINTNSFSIVGTLLT